MIDLDRQPPSGAMGMSGQVIAGRRNVPNFTGVLFLIYFFAGSASAQIGIDEIVVTAAQRERRALPAAVELNREEISELAPVALTDLLKGLPSVGIRTNSRGEAVLRLRGSEERQTSILLDGAPLFVPWDGRVDLSALPAGIVDWVQVTTSAAPIEYGTNSVLGVVDIRTPTAPMSGLHSMRAEVGTEGARSFSAVGGTRAGDADLVFGGLYRTLDGEALSDPATIPYGPIRDGARKNTDLDSNSLFAAGGVEKQWGSARVSLLSVDAKRGIAPAGHIDPSIGSPRYWRYPDWSFEQLTLNLGTDFGGETTLRSTVWHQDFEQTIDQYLDATYQVVESSEDDWDRTLGMRLILERPFGGFDMRIVGNTQTTTHEQIDTDRLNDVREPLQTFQQNIFSLGTEIDTSLSEDLVLSAAMSYDLATTPKTGGRKAQDDLSDWAASIAARWYPDQHWQIAGTLGQRTRFPTLREMYGEALGKFVLNPDLQPETALLGDLTFERTFVDGQLKFRAAPWYLRIDKTLSQRSVLVEGQRLRQRYNLNGSSGYGLEGSLSWNAGDRLEIKLNGNWQHLRARREEDGSRPALYQRPKIQISLIFDYLLKPGWDLFLSVYHMGTALDEDEEGEVVKLPTSTEINVRLFKALMETDDSRWRVYAGVDNVTDDVILPQLGLPLPGRTISAGFSYERL